MVAYCLHFLKDLSLGRRIKDMYYTVQCHLKCLSKTLQIYKWIFHATL